MEEPDELIDSNRNDSRPAAIQHCFHPVEVKKMRHGIFIDAGRTGSP
jgi:hypothetical protein